MDETEAECQLDPSFIDVETRQSLDIHALSSFCRKLFAFMNVEKHRILRWPWHVNSVVTDMYSSCVRKSVRTSQSGTDSLQFAVRSSTLRLYRDEQ